MRIIWFALCCLIVGLMAGPSLADDRFLEFPTDHYTKIYDLNTVQMLLPGRFAIIATTINNHETMRLRLKVQDVLEAYCKRPDGEYEAPAELFTLGPPDKTVDKIVVRRRREITNNF